MTLSCFVQGGLTSYIISAAQGHSEVASLLCQRGVNIEARDDVSWRPYDIYDMYGCMHASFYLPAQINDDGCSISFSNSTYLLCTFASRVSMYAVIFISIFLCEVIFGLFASSMSLLGRVHGTPASTALLIMATSRSSRFSYTGGQTLMPWIM